MTDLAQIEEEVEEPDKKIKELAKRVKMLFDRSRELDENARMLRELQLANKRHREILEQRSRKKPASLDTIRNEILKKLAETTEGIKKDMQEKSDARVTQMQLINETIADLKKAIKDSGTGTSGEIQKLRQSFYNRLKNLEVGNAQDIVILSNIITNLQTVAFDAFDDKDIQVSEYYQQLARSTISDLNKVYAKLHKHYEDIGDRTEIERLDQTQTQLTNFQQADEELTKKISEFKQASNVQEITDSLVTALTSTIDQSLEIPQEPSGARVLEYVSKLAFKLNNQTEQLMALIFEQLETSKRAYRKRSHLERELALESIRTPANNDKIMFIELEIHDVGEEFRSKWTEVFEIGDKYSESEDAIIDAISNLNNTEIMEEFVRLETKTGRTESMNLQFPQFCRVHKFTRLFFICINTLFMAYEFFIKINDHIQIQQHSIFIADLIELWYGYYKDIATDVECPPLFTKQVGSIGILSYDFQSGLYKYMENIRYQTNIYLFHPVDKWISFGSYLQTIDNKIRTMNSYMYPQRVVESLKGIFVTITDAINHQFPDHTLKFANELINICNSIPPQFHKQIYEFINWLYGLKSAQDVVEPPYMLMYVPTTQGSMKLTDVIITLNQLQTFEAFQKRAPTINVIEYLNDDQSVENMQGVAEERKDWGTISGTEMTIVEDEQVTESGWGGTEQPKWGSEVLSSDPFYQEWGDKTRRNQLKNILFGIGEKNRHLIEVLFTDAYQYFNLQDEDYQYVGYTALNSSVLDRSYKLTNEPQIIEIEQR